jgi:hypothetical protein
VSFCSSASIRPRSRADCSWLSAAGLCWTPLGALVLGPGAGRGSPAEVFLVEQTGQSDKIHSPQAWASSGMGQRGRQVDVPVRGLDLGTLDWRDLLPA